VEPPLLPPPPELLGVDGVEGAGAAGAAGVLVEPELDEDEEPALLFPLELYKSEYQPPPLRMKFPPEICRFAVFSWHLGHSSSAGAEIRCSASQAFPQLVHT
jgi:hypothetical protein